MRNEKDLDQRKREMDKAYWKEIWDTDAKVKQLKKALESKNSPVKVNKHLHDISKVIHSEESEYMMPSGGRINQIQNSQSRATKGGDFSHQKSLSLQIPKKKAAKKETKNIQSMNNLYFIF